MTSFYFWIANFIIYFETFSRPKKRKSLACKAVCERGYFRPPGRGGKIHKNALNFFFSCRTASHETR